MKKKLFETPSIDDRIKGALQRIDAGGSARQIPTHPFDYDIVLHDAQIEIEQLRESNNYWKQSSTDWQARAETWSSKVQPVPEFIRLAAQRCVDDYGKKHNNMVLYWLAEFIVKL